MTSSSRNPLLTAMDGIKDPCPFCAISLHGGDEIRLFNFPTDLEQQFADVVATSWPRGIQKRILKGEAVRFQLRGHPWLGVGAQGVSCRVLMKNVLAFMYYRGWGVAVTSDLYKAGDKDTVYFRRVDPNPKARFCAISFHKTDRLRAIGVPEQLQAAVVECVRSKWRRGIQEEIHHHGATEIKIRGNPWYAEGAEANESRVLVLHLISTLEGAGWSVYASVDFSGETEDGDHRQGDFNTWILKSNESWEDDGSPDPIQSTYAKLTNSPFESSTVR